MAIELGDHEALAPCPMCGGEALATQDVTGTWGVDLQRWEIVRCTACSVSVGMAKRCMSAAEAREAWNRRPE